MNKILSLLVLPLMLGALAACSDDSEEVATPEEVATRIEIKGSDVKFYMDGYNREASFMENLAYIIFHEADKDAVVAALEKKKGSSLVYTDTLFFMDSPDAVDASSYEILADGIYQFKGCKRAAVKMNYNDLIDIPEVIDAEPYFYFTYPNISLPDGVVPVTNQIRISSGYGEKLEQTAKEANAIVLGKVSLSSQAFWVVARTKDTVGGNTFETMKFFEEAGHRTEPLIHSGWAVFPPEIHIITDGVVNPNNY